MIDARVIKQIEGVSTDVDKRLVDTLDSIVPIAYMYRYKGKAFTFSVSSNLESMVDKKIGELCNYLIEDNDARIQETYGYTDNEEMIDDLFRYVDRDIDGKTRKDRYEGYCGWLKKSIEGWLAVGFAAGLSEWQVRSAILNGNTHALTLARKEGGFATDLDSKAMKTNIPKWMSLVGTQAVTEAFHVGTLEGFAKNPDVIGYRVLRGSSYPCALCDELTMHTYRLDDIVIPAHPRCVCYAVPVTKPDI